MLAPDEQVRIGFGVFFFVVPAAVGWAGGRSGHGSRFARVFAIHSALATTLGLPGVLLARWYLIPSPIPASAPGPASPPYVSSDRVDLFMLSEVLVFAALPLTIIACGSALAQVRIEKRWGWLVILLCLSAIPVALADVLFTLDFLRDEPNRTLISGACVLGALATLGIAAYTFAISRSGSPDSVVAI